MEEKVVSKRPRTRITGEPRSGIVDFVPKKYRVINVGGQIRTQYYIPGSFFQKGIWVDFGYMHGCLSVEEAEQEIEKKRNSYIKPVVNVLKEINV